jgi:hypothetical protein
VSKKFQPGDFAEHKYRDLDAREVTEVSEDGKQIKIWILSAQTDWIPAENYNNLGARS